MFRKMPIILIVFIVTLIFLDKFIPLQIKECLYAISLSIKSIIVFFLPFIIFGLLFKAAVSLSNNATRVIGIILAFVCCSNFISTFLSHYVGILVYQFDLSMISPKELSTLNPLWTFNLSALIQNDRAMFAGIITGIVFAYFFRNIANEVAAYVEKFTSIILNFIVYLIPFFVAGFVVKLQYDNVMHVILENYTAIFILIMTAQFSYIALGYFILNNCHIKESILAIKNMLPAAISGFSTMSSASSMPLTIIGAESNAKNKEIVRSVIPATVNIHLIGDCFAIPIMAYAVLKSYGVAEPSFDGYMIFAFYFVLAKFSVAGIPGGGIIVMLPILESYLNFNTEMMSLITALYILFDPLITCANVLGNGAFAKMMDRVIPFLTRKTPGKV